MISRLFVAAVTLAAVVLAAASARPAQAMQTNVEIVIHYSTFAPTTFTVPAGVPITFILRNDDPIDHEWLVGDAAFHARHRRGGEAVHGDRPDEVSLPPISARSTTLTFAPGTYAFICHFPGHEAYGMVGTMVAR